MRKIFLDVSDTVSFRLNTGIQRVVKRIVAEAIHVAADFDVEIVPVVALGDKVAPLNAAGLEVLHTPRKETGLPDAGLIQGYSLVKRVMKAFPGTYQYVRRKYSEYRSFGGLHAKTVRRLNDGDVLVFLDSFWNDNRAARIGKVFYSSKLTVVSVIYDVIPITHPEYCDSTLVSIFASAFDDMVDYGVRFISISKDSATTVNRIAHGRGYKGSVSSFYLGHDLPAATSPAPMTWPEHLWSGDDPVHLMVGTIEPRKGVDTVLAAMELLWSRGRTDKLLVVGRIGWMTGELVSRAQSHPEFGRKLFFVHHANDTMLSYAYKNARDWIIASRIEGFGLPLVEALSNSLPVIASDIDVFREISPDIPVYFKCDDEQDLARAIDIISNDYDARRAMAEGFHWINWRDSARQFVAGVLAQVDDAKSTDAPAVDSTASAS